MIDELRILFRLPGIVLDQVQAKYDSLLKSIHLEKCAVVHIRRSDYVKFPRIHGILSPEYFQGAIARAKQVNPNIDQLIVFSDDLPWCKTQSFLQGSIFIDEPNDVFALWLMSQFRNFVMSNSSFSWWAVMLGT